MDFPFFDPSLGAGTLLLLVLALGVALAFEFVNGFHDTANAVATVIYTNSLRPRTAVLWSGLCNFLGVYLGGIGVAFSIVYLLPVDLLIAIGSGAGMAMVLALLSAAILWNFGTWYFGIPASSSHTLIGAILGVGLASSLLPGRVFGSGVNWAKAGQVGASLVISPLIGFGAAALLLLLSKRLFQDAALHKPPAGDKPPPWWVRGVLIFTCTGVSAAHGSNDGQKGIGLIMLILIGLLPARYALNLGYSPEQIQQTVQAARDLEQLLQRDQAAAALQSSPDGVPSAAPQLSPAGGAPERWPGSSVEAGAIAQADLDTLGADLAEIQSTLGRAGRLADVAPEVRWDVRTAILRVDYALAKIEGLAAADLSPEELGWLRDARRRLRGITDYAPTWVLIAVATALGVGTTVGWKRIVVTVGEKIGKAHMTYAQGASAELVATAAIGLADFLHLPVSTTHVLASGVAGTMAANHSGIQAATVRNIALAWVLTLPAAMLLSGGLFLLFRLFLA
jgi:inorganic phosphate transporter, PiT family